MSGSQGEHYFCTVAIWVEETLAGAFSMQRREEAKCVQNTLFYLIVNRAVTLPTLLLASFIQMQSFLDHGWSFAENKQSGQSCKKRGLWFGVVSETIFYAGT